MATPFRVGFIGAGGIARTHMKNLQPLEGVEVCAAADPSEMSLKKLKEDFPHVRQFTDFKVMLKEVECDAIDVCTPNGLHAENTIAALDAGKHVMVEKPMAMNAKEAQAMLDASKRNGKQIIVGFQHRFDPKTKLIRDQIANDSFGKILYVRAQALRRRGIPNWGVFGRKELQGGGPMIDIGVHILETAHYMIGSPKPVAASGSAWTYMGNKPSEVASMWPQWDHRTYNVEDLAVGMIRFDNGTVLVIESSFIAHIEKDIFNVTLMGEKGGAAWDTSQIFTDHGGYQMNMAPGWIGKWDVFEYKMKHFVDVCRDGRLNESPGEHGLMVQKMLDGIYASSEKGREVGIE
ncbi:MAG: Gfo/Idh/MocA family oxidoreductase [Tepidisphaeraceae bacterium]